MSRVWLVISVWLLGSACSSSEANPPSGSGGSGGTGLAESGGSAGSGAGPSGGSAGSSDASAGDADAANDTSLGGAAGAAAFVLGSEYAAMGLGATYAATGVVATKLQPEIVMWQRIEPKAPVAGVHAYDFSCVDALILEHQKAGQTQLQAYISPKSYWASVDCPNDLGCKDIAPKPASLDDFRAFIRAVVERYDGDGLDDAPGLVTPIREWVFGGEWTGFWPKDDADSYLATLTVVREEAKKADSTARMGLIPFMLFDVFIGNPPSATSIQNKLKDPPPGFRNSTAGMLTMLDHPELFDFVDVHSLGDYSEIPALLAWFRAEMKKRGYERPLMIDDAFPIGMLANGAGWPASYGVVDKNKTYQSLLAVADPAGPDYTKSLAWVRAEVARGLIKKVMVAAAEGAAGIQIGNTEDWMDDTQVKGLLGRETSIFLTGAAAMMGLVDVTHPNGLDVCKARLPGKPRPGIRALEQVATALSGFTQVTPLSGLGAGVWAYRIERPGSPILVAWHENDTLELPGVIEAPVAVLLPLAGATSAKLTRAVTDVSAPAPTSSVVGLQGGNVPVQLDATPVFVEATP